jgi:hypothetical protein
MRFYPVTVSGQAGSTDKVSALYSASVRLESRAEHRVYCSRIFVVSSVPPGCFQETIKWDHYCLLPHPYRFLIHHCLLILRCSYSVSCWMQIGFYCNMCCSSMPHYTNIILPRRGFELDIGFIDHLCMQLGTTSNCSAIATPYSTNHHSTL